MKAWKEYLIGFYEQEETDVNFCLLQIGVLRKILKEWGKKFPGIHWDNCSKSNKSGLNILCSKMALVHKHIIQDIC